MHQKHVEPTKEIAELVINNGREGKKFVGNAVK
jgi:uridine kinase